ncbi:helix-turn-helix transcriptional regulator [Kitasatospora sp. CB02891]|uniref:helix-turn-helix domain-containing protein n=1 Tax=Kitasatospora sp. CB02891 TaxID=2020329 RepID=UPI000C27AA6A|nr:helix-turn-helix transcriptional regulator [Kitasatospora sp. CB02891]PJN22399.1 hypothetical protein CG736_28210 [Kitasatospora sp. CB02891]
MTIPLHGQPLTPHESETLTRLARGHRYADIALDTYGGLNSVKTTLRRVYRKLGAASGPHAVALAIAAGSLPTDVAAPSVFKED